MFARSTSRLEIAEAAGAHANANDAPSESANRHGEGDHDVRRIALRLRSPAPLPEFGSETPEGPPSWFADAFGSLFGDVEEAETPTELGRPRVIRRRPARRSIAALQEEELAGFYTALPAPGESLHVVSNGKFDYWRFVPVTLALLGRPADELYGSTWTMSRQNVRELLALLDAGQIRSASILTGTYFLRRESAVAATLQEGLRARGQRYRAFANHTKVVLLGAPPDWIVLEGSANWTANPRLEQNLITNDEGLYRFHREWMEHFLPRRSA